MKTKISNLLTIILVLFFVGAFAYGDSCCAKHAEKTRGGEKMKISSPEFKNNEFIPRKFTCQGEDINPALVFEDIPANTKTLALIVDDPDAPGGMWVHWVVYDIPIIK